MAAQHRRRIAGPLISSCLGVYSDKSTLVKHVLYLPMTSDAAGVLDTLIAAFDNQPERFWIGQDFRETWLPMLKIVNLPNQHSDEVLVATRARLCAPGSPYATQFASGLTGKILRSRLDAVRRRRV